VVDPSSSTTTPPRARRASAALFPSPARKSGWADDAGSADEQIESSPILLSVPLGRFLDAPVVVDVDADGSPPAIMPRYSRPDPSVTLSTSSRK
jgi:hypothetical protein